MAMVLAFIGTVIWFIFWWMVADLVVNAAQIIAKHVKRWRRRK